MLTPGGPEVRSGWMAGSWATRTTRSKRWFRTCACLPSILAAALARLLDRRRDLDGMCLVGKWWMQPGDVLVSAAGLEYGPVLAGPEGCQLYEVFAQNHLSPGGYAMEYHDHATLAGAPFTKFFDRSPLKSAQ